LVDTRKKLHKINKNTNDTSLMTELEVEQNFNRKLESRIEVLLTEIQTLQIAIIDRRDPGLGEDKEKLERSLKNWREKANNLDKTLRLNMNSTSKIDNVRIMLSEKVKLLCQEKEELEVENREFQNALNSLRAQLENIKGGDYVPEFQENMQFEKTKGTFSDKGTSQQGNSRIICIDILQFTIT
jgi:chromosome segregation ATPase